MERLACISIAVGQGSLNHTPCRPIGLEKDQPEDSLLPLRSPGHTGLMPPLPWNEEASRFLNASCMLHVFTLPISVGFDPLIYFVLPAPSTHLEATEQKWRHCSQERTRKSSVAALSTDTQESPSMDALRRRSLPHAWRALSPLYKPHLNAVF